MTRTFFRSRVILIGWSNQWDFPIILIPMSLEEAKRQVELREKIKGQREEEVDLGISQTRKGNPVDIGRMPLQSRWLGLFPLAIEFRKDICIMEKGVRVNKRTTPLGYPGSFRAADEHYRGFDSQLERLNGVKTPGKSSPAPFFQ